MKIGVISDTHLREITDWLRELIEVRFRDTEMILHAGDIGSGAVLNYLLSNGVVAVQGNMDGGNSSFLLPNKQVVQVEGYRIGLIHGWGAPNGLAERVRVEFEGLDGLVFGHSHEPFNQWVSGELWFNPGSAGSPRGGHTRSAGFIHLDKGLSGEIFTFQEPFMDNLWAPWRMTYILGKDPQSRRNECIFCVDDGQTRPDRDRLILHVGGLSMVMMNRYPYNNCHLLIAPLRHVADPTDLTSAEMSDLMSKIRDAVSILRKEVRPEGFNVGLNLGAVAGAGVEAHLHFHVVPRWNGDTNFMTVFDDVRVVPEHILATYDRLLPHFQGLEDFA